MLRAEVSTMQNSFTVGLLVVLSLVGCHCESNAGGPNPPRDVGTDEGGAVRCSDGYSCYTDEVANVVWVVKDDGNINGPDCQQVCEDALSYSASFHSCDDGRQVTTPNIDSFAPVAEGLGFSCKEGGCWDEAPGTGMLLVSIDTDSSGAKSCFFPSESTFSCRVDPGNANCFGERYSTVCPCVTKALDAACEWTCPPNNTTTATWNTDGTSCLERINYWRQRACDEGWVECPPAGLPPMVECTACHQCVNSQAEFDADNGAHASFTRCGELVQGEGGGATCADVIDSFVAERAPDSHGVMRCEGHCGPIVAPGCRTFSWGRDRDSAFHTLDWGGCSVETCDSYCEDHPGACFTVATSPSLVCE
jgi:hypothetical protein